MEKLIADTKDYMDVLAWMQGLDGSSRTNPRFAELSLARFGRLARVFQGWPWLDSEGDHEAYQIWWCGIMPGHPAFLGALLSYFGDEPLLQRGYPRVLEIKAPLFEEQPHSIQAMAEGIQVYLFRLPNGMLWSRGRFVEFNRKTTYYATDLEELLRSTPSYQRVADLTRARPELCVVGELFGGPIPAVSLEPDAPVDFVGFDLLDTKTQMFLPPRQSLTILREYGIATPQEYPNVEDAISALDQQYGVVFKFWEPDGTLYPYAMINPEMKRRKADFSLGCQSGGVQVAKRRLWDFT